MIIPIPDVREKDMNIYCNSLTEYSRYKTRVVSIGDVPLGGDNPIRIQSMTTTDTMDTIATVEQTIRMVEAGCEYVRITAPGIKEAENLANIKAELLKRGYKVPLIADIHFTPNAAEAAARIVEKVRVNPGNYIDRKHFQTLEYTDAEYNAEIDRIRQRFSPLVKICKEYGTAMRIGTNHGSLSDRIMSRFGDSPLGMVESALEFVRICEELDYHNIVLSMKASNTQVMVQAYRLLVQKMQAEGMNYPLHLGVTEAGDGEDGRVKSALGIGTLLEDGLGDTIRVSLTEEPEHESPVAIMLAERYKNRAGHKPIKPIIENPINPVEYKRRKTIELTHFGGSNVPRVIADYQNTPSVSTESLSKIGYYYTALTDKWSMTDSAADFIYMGKQIAPFNLPQSLRAIYDFGFWKENGLFVKGFPLFTAAEYPQHKSEGGVFNFVSLTIDDLTNEFIHLLTNDKTAILVLDTNNAHGLAEQRRACIELMNAGIGNPVILRRNYQGVSYEQFMLYSATDFGGLLIDGLGDGVWVSGLDDAIVGKEVGNRILFGILQAARTRISKTEYIACPSCGRTLFDLVETTNKIRVRTEHLKGVKIAVMGCIVNGPGEMADADYGYVGSGPGKITLYRGKDVVKKSVPSAQAVDELIALISEDGRWVEPSKF
jgi:(E)-4-hydroxy-3-methylbut-2-enyl-diphosphate synthase